MERCERQNLYYVHRRDSPRRQHCVCGIIIVHHEQKTQNSLEQENDAPFYRTVQVRLI